MSDSPSQTGTLLHPEGTQEEVLVISDDSDRARRSLEREGCSFSGPVLETVSEGTDPKTAAPVTLTDGGGQTAVDWDADQRNDRMPIEAVLRDGRIDTAVFLFDQYDRDDFFRILRNCREYGVNARVPRDRTESVVTDRSASDDDPFVDVELEPWGPVSRGCKRCFDALVAAAGLLASLPLMLLLTAAVKLDSPGPAFYSQERTTRFGGTFQVYKFRTMVEDAESKTGPVVSDEDAGGVDPRVTRVGYILRRTHLDELPQLWSVLTGEMSIVGPRPDRPKMEAEFVRELPAWRQRWFVKPGLTGLAQVNKATSYQPDEKLRYDIDYIRRQSLALDIKIFTKQVAMVVNSVVGLFSDGDRAD